MIKAWMPRIALPMAGVLLVVGPSIAVEPTIANQPVNLSPSTDSASETATASGAPTPAPTTAPTSAPTTAPATSAAAKESLPIGGARSKAGKTTSRRTKTKLGRSAGYWQAVLALGAVLALIGLLAYAARRWMPGMQPLRTASLQIMGRTQISPKQSIAVVKVGGRLVLIGVTPDRISQLSTVDEPQEVAEILADLKHGPSKGQGPRLFNPLFDEASEAYREAENDERQTDLDSPEAADYEQTRGQIRGLLSKVKMLTSGRWVG